MVAGRLPPAPERRASRQPPIRRGVGFGVDFAGDTTYASASAPATLAVRIATKLTYTGATRAVRNASINLSATLKTASGGTAIAGKTVTFSLNGATLDATTNDSGVASVVTTAPGTIGKYQIGISFPGGFDVRRGLDLGHAHSPLTST